MAFILDGFSTVFVPSAAPLVELREREVTPIGLDGGGEVDTTTMLNSRWRTKNPKYLVTADDFTALCNYDPVVYATIITSLINVNNLISIFFPDGSSVDFWGWLDKFKPQALREGEFPLAEVTIHASNHDNTTPLPVEVAPIYNAP